MDLNILKESRYTANWDTIEGLSEKARNTLFNVINLRVSSYLNMIKGAESPIEELMGIALIDAALTRGLINMGTSSQINIGKYRVDFLLTHNDSGFKFVVECDGHDFHEKTKEQASKDKLRDRFLLSNGYIVIRFTGSEVFNSPFECAEEVCDIIEKFVG